MHGVQFHPEVDLTPRGKEILANELGVVFNNADGKGRRDSQEGVGGDFDPDLVSTEGTVEGGYYSHRAAILWTGNNVVLVTHQNMEGALLARISLDGGKTWLDGTTSGAPSLSNAKGFVMTDDHSFPAPTVELSVDHFLTVCVSQGNVEGFFWHIERDGDDIGLNH